MAYETCHHALAWWFLTREVKPLKKAIIFIILLCLVLAGCEKTKIVGTPVEFEPVAEPSEEVVVEVEEGITPEPVTEENITELEEVSEVVEISEENTIKIIGLAFEPRELTVKVSTLVTWVNADPVKTRAHGITSIPSGIFRSSRMRNNDTFKHTFTEPGEYEYTDLIFPGDVKRGKITVVE